MIHSKQSQPLLHSEGTSQQDRFPNALNPEYVQVEGRSVADLIMEAQRLAKEIRFFDETNQPVSNWEAFLVDNFEEYDRKSETGKEIHRKRWAQQLAAYLDHPESFRHDAEKLAQLSRPHVVLFLSFLQLLTHIKTQLNGLPKAHLDFYFLERLGMTPKSAVPDEVNVIVELANHVNQLEVPLGTLLSAGTDDQGNEMLYQTDLDTVITDAKIAQLKTVYVDKQIITIRDAHLNNQRELDKGFGKMMELALGSPFPGDSLPPFPDGLESLVQVYDRLKQNDQPAAQYVENDLGFSPKDNFKDFAFVMETHLQDNLIPVGKEVWESVYGLLDQAFKNKVKQSRRNIFKDLRIGDLHNGVDIMLKHAFGRPEAGDELPLYYGNPANIATIYQELTAPANGDIKIRDRASAYIAEELLLTDKELITLGKTIQNPNATDDAWREVYAILELANRKVRGIVLQSPIREELYNVYAEADAKARAFSLYGEKEESLRFRTMGGEQAGSNQPLSPAELGFAITSPILQLEEGKRSITALFSFLPTSAGLDRLKALVNNPQIDFAPFKVFLSTEKKWLEITEPSFSIVDHIVGPSNKAYTATLSNHTVTKTDGEDFSPLDLGKYLVWMDGTIMEITQILNNQSVKIQIVGQVERIFISPVLKYDREAVYLSAMRVSIALQEEDLPIVATNPKEVDQFLASAFPTLVISLNHALKEKQNKPTYLSHYQVLKDLAIDKMHLSVDVEGIRMLTLLNDQSDIDPKKPFEPFGPSPEVGSSFYLANPEISQKRIDDLRLDLQWMKKPDDLVAHYENYWKVMADNPSLSPAAFDIQQENDFKAQLYLYDHRAELPLTETPIFTSDGKLVITGIPQTILAHSPSYQYTSQSDFTPAEDLLDWNRYFRLELHQHDFQHAAYSGVIRKQALSDQPDIRKLTLPLPYTPKLKSIKAGYTAHMELLPAKSGKLEKGADGSQFYHLHPFGYASLDSEEIPRLLPSYNHEGALYLGLEKLIKPQTLSILFQLSEGSANPDVAKPALRWSYLRGSEWKDLAPSAILSDSTNGLLNTGIVRLSIPTDATEGDTIMPGKLHWLKLSCDQGTGGVSDTIEVLTQAVSATFVSQSGDSRDAGKPLPAKSITETLEFNPAIQKIEQPFTSSKGKPAERDESFYNRISERLRHKNRAINMWDYERMVLDKFPEVYKAKCLPAIEGQGTANLGKVHVLVIPDIKGKLPFNPFEPKVPSDTLFQIQSFLDNHTPAYAEVVVKNPTYLQIKTRCVVKFKPGYNEGFYKAKLVDELKRFLAPWAYGDGETITIGGSIYASVILNFIAERPYIAYVTNLKLFQSEDGEKFTDVRSVNEGQNKVIATRPDTVLVSAQTHEIDIVDENGYDEDNFEGINYMKIELDFMVGENELA